MLRRAPEAGPTFSGDRRLSFRAIGIVVPLAVWVLGIVPGPARGLSVEYVITVTLLLVGMLLVDLVMPLEQPQGGAWWRRAPSLIAQLVLGFALVPTHGTPI